MIWILAVAACATHGDPAWYEGPEPCPDGATLQGAAWSEALAQETALTCVTAEGIRHGPHTRWAADGALLAQGHFEDDQAVTMTLWDSAGREVATFEGDLWHRSWWHSDTQLAAQGTLTPLHQPVGTWTSWDPQGTQDGQVTYDADGAPGPLTGTNRLVLYADQAVVPLLGSIDVPVASQGGPLVAAVAITVTADALLVDGAPVARLDQGSLDPGDLRGQLITPAYDVLADKAFQARDLDTFDGRALILAAPDTPWATLRAVLYTAGQAQFGTFDFVALERGVAWPGPTGPVPVLGAHTATLPRIGPPTDDPGPPYVSVMSTSEGAQVLVPGIAPQEVSMAELHDALARAATPELADAIVVVPHGAADAQTVVDLLAATGARDAVLVGGAQ